MEELIISKSGCQQQTERIEMDQEIQPVRKYTAADMAKIYCAKCNGCGDCCHGMTDTIHLDPYDIYMLSSGLGQSFEELHASGAIALHAEDGMILPHLKMADGPEGACPFLGADGRCRIHAFRPGLCRLFPLGRDYDADTHTFRYFIVDNGCPMPGKMKVKISKWIGIPDLADYEQYIAEWHYFCRDAKSMLTSSSDAKYNEQWNLFVLKVFYVTPYVIPEDGSQNFYSLFHMRLQQARSVL